MTIIENKAEKIRENADDRVKVSVMEKGGGLHGIVKYIKIEFPKEPYSPIILQGQNEINRFLMAMGLPK